MALFVHTCMHACIWMLVVKPFVLFKNILTRCFPLREISACISVRACVSILHTYVYTSRRQTNDGILSRRKTATCCTHTHTRVYAMYAHKCDIHKQDKSKQAASENHHPKGMHATPCSWFKECFCKEATLHATMTTAPCSVCPTFLLCIPFADKHRIKSKEAEHYRVLRLRWAGVTLFQAELLNKFLLMKA